jgi:DNA repair exonuclease SbcCD nuclease subunit
MKIFITGDTHIPHDISKLNSTNFSIQKTFKEAAAIVIICGDFGLLWKNHPDKEEEYWTKWLNERTYTVAFVDGNHENFARLNRLSEVEMFGGKVGKVSDKIYHLKRGEIYNIDGKKFFCMGGARSTDKSSRIANVDWWKEEECSCKEIENALSNLEKNNNEVDYIIAHTLPVGMIYRYYKISEDDVIRESYIRDNIEDSVSKFLQEVCNRVKFKKYFCGHFHDDKQISNFNILFEEIIEIK